ncbi:cysteine hydrolase family protein [Chitinophaga sp. Cy-1792]|uniref:cysteine hydrolase family protein n=1 Tax=Chitinophaga sp. Cy-1792 TaxID=2608339 RepID=UPI00141E0DB2|nr:cysteine hydrolase [Chitinophaga sp. Cy-1792]NIG55605.1 cysteine hydrolase [Chitinophaga sp. Cy-1792]
MAQNKENTALLVMDMQEQMLSHLPGAAATIAPVAAAISHARENNIPVIYVVVGFRKGYHEIHPENKTFSQVPKMYGDIDPAITMKIAPALAPQDNEPVVVKKRFSAFAGSDLELVLRSKGIRHIVMCGIITSGVVLSTLIEGADKDYIMTVLSDGCADMDIDLHQTLLQKVFPRHADVKTSEEWINS